MNYVNDFWSWAGVSSTEYSESGMQNGEHVYEDEYPLFDDMIDYAKGLIATPDIDMLAIEDVLIILALDHESEELLDYMVKYCPACNISRIVDLGVKHIQPGTRWQIAELIYRRKLFDYMHCVRQLCNDKNHYVSKRALNLVRIFG